MKGMGAPMRGSAEAAKRSTKSFLYASGRVRSVVGSRRIRFLKRDGRKVAASSGASAFPGVRSGCSG